jgi:hypothetical protein
MAMAKATILATFAAVAALAAVQLAAAADHPVGGDGSWDASGTTGYDAWSAKQTFKQGDTLCKLALSSVFSNLQVERTDDAAAASLVHAGSLPPQRSSSRRRTT